MTQQMISPDKWWRAGEVRSSREEFSVIRSGRWTLECGGGNTEPELRRPIFWSQLSSQQQATA